MSARALRISCALVLAALWGAFLGFSNLRGGIPALDGLEATLTDIRMQLRGPRPSPGLVTIVAIDDATVQQEGSYPLSRATLARLVTKIAEFGPRAIALDILLVDPRPGGGDEQLAEALRASPSVIASAAVFGSSEVPAEGDGLLAGVPMADRLLLPQQAFAEAAAVGVVNVATDRNGTPRSVPLLFRSASRLDIALALQAASLASGAPPVIEPGSVVVGGVESRTDKGNLLPLAFYGPRGTVKTVSAAMVLNGEPSPNDMKGQVFVIGATVTGGGDVFPTPFDPVLPGVEVVATAVTHLLAGDGLVRDVPVRLADAGIAIALPVTLIGLLAWRRNAIGLTLIAFLILAFVALNAFAFASNIWLSLGVPLAAFVPPLLIFGVSELWLGRSRAQHFATQSAMLQRIQAPGMAKWLAHDPEFLTHPMQLDAAIVFIDLSGFTGLSEALGTKATREVLDAFYHLVEEEVTRHSGAITSFMGDGVMIMFGLPAASPEDAPNAARCCVDLSARTRQWVHSLPRDISTAIGFKVGAHYGEVVASRLGSGDIQQLATTGDTVNVASRLMGIAASNGAELALSDQLLSAAGREIFGSGLRGPVETPIRGRVGTLSVWLWDGRY